MNLRRFFSLFFILFFSFNVSADFFKDTTIGRNIISELKNLSISTKVDILDFESTTGVSSKLKYQYKLEPSFISNRYARIDEWSIINNINVGDVLDSVSPVHFNIQKGSKVVFLRNFENQWEGIKALPYTLKNLPYNAKTTLERLKVGDFVSFPATMNINLGVGTGAQVYPYQVGEIGRAHV